MALSIMPTAPATTGAIQIRDFAPQLSDATKSNATAVQNAFKFGTNIHDYAVSRGQGKLLGAENERVRILQENIANDEVLLEKLQQELVQLIDGNDVELRKGQQMMSQNRVPTLQRSMNLLEKTDKDFWNFRPMEGQ